MPSTAVVIELEVRPFSLSNTIGCSPDEVEYNTPVKIDGKIMAFNILILGGQNGRASHTTYEDW